MGEEGRSFIKTSRATRHHEVKDMAKACKVSIAMINKGEVNSNDDTPAVNPVGSSSTKGGKKGNSFEKGAHSKI